MEKFGPCQDKSCGHCCDPVKIDIKSQGNTPTDKNGKDIFIQKEEILAPEMTIEKTRLKTYVCINYDSVNKVCLDYENRPDICKSSTCITDENGDIDSQHKKL